MADFLTLDVDGGIGTIRLDRPPMNALNAQVQDELLALCGEIRGRADVRAVVVHGGEKVFAAGADIKEMATMSYTDMVERSTALQAAFTALAELPVPTVAAITGTPWGAAASSRWPATSGSAPPTPSSASPRSCSASSPEPVARNGFRGWWGRPRPRT